ncbi:hypothetical protein Rsub_05054 [Raphidocelis subcapitata]|uniref:Uncharacterized protein n=1 Tax=Raphidocelis subcapitata TaxID=307507 RepID=A0A2V0P6G6_9CHLO|nr:hypothetical protein Rsub_05054 [Raphidocelis subcapitata]|eukprot:GBF92685.1 hypothetical protein Rsub_05054 [Raphidocelis subcapitata]
MWRSGSARGSSGEGESGGRSGGAAAAGGRGGASQTDVLVIEEPPDGGAQAPEPQLLPTGFGDDGAGPAGAAGLDDDEDLGLPPAWVRYSAAGVNVAVASVALATAKQLFSPATLFGGPGAAAPGAPPPPGAAAAAAKAAEELPEWMRQRYGYAWGGAAGGAAGRSIVRRIARDSAVLMGASASWYGVQAAAQWARGGADDAANTTLAGAVSAAFLGAKLFGDAARGRAALRVGLWAAAGAWMGRAAWEDRRRVQQLLLKRQQELEQSHLGVPPERVKGELDRELLVRLLRREAKARAARVQQQVQAGAGGGAAGAAGGGPAGAGAGAGGGGADDDAAWRQLIESPPWLVDGGQDNGGGQGNRGGRGNGGGA